MKKNNIKIIIAASLNLAVCLTLLILLVPEEVPYLTTPSGNIAVMGSKWFLLLGIVFPLVFATLFVATKKESVKIIMTELIILFLYENMLGYSYFCTEKTFLVGTPSLISNTLSLFLPIAILTFYYGARLKAMPYKHVLGIRSKHTTTTQFIWTQSHITAHHGYMVSGFFMFITSMVFVFVNQIIVESAIFVLLFVIPRIYVIQEAKKMSKKYNEMNERKEKQQIFKDLERELAEEKEKEEKNKG